MEQDWLFFPILRSDRQPTAPTVVIGSRYIDHWVKPHRQKKHARTINDGLPMPQAQLLGHYFLSSTLRIAVKLSDSFSNVCAYSRGIQTCPELRALHGDAVKFFNVILIRDTKIHFTIYLMHHNSKFLTVFRNKSTWHLKVVRKGMFCSSVRIGFQRNQYFCFKRRPFLASGIWLAWTEWIIRIHHIFKISLNPSPWQSEHHLEIFAPENWRHWITWNSKVIPLNAPESLMVTEYSLRLPWLMSVGLIRSQDDISQLKLLLFLLFSMNKHDTIHDSWVGIHHYQYSGSHHISLIIAVTRMNIIMTSAIVIRGD